MNKYYITFGQIHVHSVNGKTFDKDCLAEIEANSPEEAHKLAMIIFKKAFHNCYGDMGLDRILPFYPRGIIKVKNKGNAQGFY